MPNKHNADRRHHIPKMAFKVQNWPEYEAGLRRRGSLTLWIEDAVLDQWQSVGPHGQARYEDIAIETCLMLRAAFKLALRQTEGLLDSVLTDDLGAGSHHGQPTRGGTDGHEVKLSAKGSPACVDRQYRPGGLRRRAVAGSKARREIAPHLAQAASGSRYRQRHDRRAGSYRSAYGRPVLGGTTAGSGRTKDRQSNRRRRL